MIWRSAFLRVASLLSAFLATAETPVENDPSCTAGSLLQVSSARRSRGFEDIASAARHAGDNSGYEPEGSAAPKAALADVGGHQDWPDASGIDLGEALTQPLPSRPASLLDDPRPQASHQVIQAGVLPTGIGFAGNSGIHETLLDDAGPQASRQVIPAGVRASGIGFAGNAGVERSLEALESALASEPAPQDSLTARGGSGVEYSESPWTFRQAAASGGVGAARAGPGLLDASGVSSEYANRRFDGAFEEAADWEAPRGLAARTRAVGRPIDDLEGSPRLFQAPLNPALDRPESLLLDPLNKTFESFVREGTSLGGGGGKKAKRTKEGTSSGFFFLVQAPGVMIMVIAVVVSSAVALLSFGRAAHIDEMNNPKVWTKSFSDLPSPRSVGGRPGTIDESLSVGSIDAPGRPRLTEESSSMADRAHTAKKPHFVPARPPPPPGPDASAVEGSHADLSLWGDPLPVSHYLCPSLVVPRKNECILAVPTMEGAVSCFDVHDLAGEPAVQVEVRVPDWSSGRGLEQQPSVVLRACQKQDANGAAQVGRLLAYCKVERGTSARDETQRAHIYDANGGLFGTVRARVSNGVKRYSLASGRGSVQLSIEGDFEDLAVNIWSTSRELFGDCTSACTPPFDPYGSYWQLRVLANMDVGVILSAILCVQLLEGRKEHDGQERSREG